MSTLVSTTSRRVDYRIVENAERVLNSPELVDAFASLGTSVTDLSHLDTETDAMVKIQGFVCTTCVDRMNDL